MNLRYRIIKRCPFRANSQRCQVLRQQFSIQLLEILAKDVTLISQDETFLNINDHRRMCWRERGVSHSQATKPIAPRISVLGAIDTNGQVYTSLS